MTTLDRIDLHIASLYVLDEKRRMLAVNDFEGTPPPRLSIIRSPLGMRCLLSARLPEPLFRELDSLAAQEPALANVPRWPLYRKRYRELLELHSSVRAEYGGPAFVLPDRRCRDENVARVLVDDDRVLLETHFDWLIPEFADAEPVAGVIADGVVVTICRCARRRTAAVEAGVETAPAYRGRGFAKHATARWAAAMRVENLLPLYSTSWDNTASLRVAAALAAEQYAVDYNVT
jgi:GNAT superfamily N-acetyltransferase